MPFERAPKLLDKKSSNKREGNFVFDIVKEYHDAVAQLPHNDRQLFDLVSSCFTPDELLRLFVTDLNARGWFLKRGLPDNCLVFEFLRTYVGLGNKIDETFFQKMHAERPLKKDEIDRVQQLVLSEASTGE